MSKKTRTVSNKAGKLMKCDGQMLKKVVEAKGYKLHELSKMLRYCSDYLTTCCRTNKISDVAAKYLMDYKIFPQMYDLEGEIKVDEPNEDKTKTDGEHVRGKLYIGEPEEVKIDKDDRNEVKYLCLNWPSRSPYESKYFRSMAPEIKKVLNEKYGKLEKGVEGIDYGYGPAPKNTRYCSYYAAGHDIAKGVFKLIHAAMDDLKHDPEFKAMIKQAVKEAYEEL